MTDLATSPSRHPCHLSATTSAANCQHRMSGNLKIPYACEAWISGTRLRKAPSKGASGSIGRRVTLEPEGLTGHAVAKAVGTRLVTSKRNCAKGSWAGSHRKDEAKKLQKVGCVTGVAASISGFSVDAPICSRGLMPASAPAKTISLRHDSCESVLSFRCQKVCDSISICCLPYREEKLMFRTPIPFMHHVFDIFVSLRKCTVPCTASSNMGWYQRYLARSKV